MVENKSTKALASTMERPLNNQASSPCLADTSKAPVLERSEAGAQSSRAQNISIKGTETVVIYTDGSCLRNPGGRGGYGCVLLHKEYCQEIVGGFRRTTNNRMEIMAAIVALKSFESE